MILKSWMITVPLMLLAVGTTLALLQHPVLGGEIVASGLALLSRMIAR